MFWSVNDGMQFTLYRKVLEQTLFLLLLLWIAVLVKCVHSEEEEEQLKESLTTYDWELRMPGVSTTKPDQHLCTTLALNSSKEEWLLAFEPHVTTREVHHMTLFGCSDTSHETGVRICEKRFVCFKPRHINMWNTNTPTSALPAGVGFHVGGDTDIQYLTLQVHYAAALPNVQDHSGLTIRVTSVRQPLSAGILSITSSPHIIPPNTKRAHLDAACQLRSVKILDDIHVIGYRLHTHKYGTVVRMYRHDTKTGEYDLVMEGNPHWVQAMYPRDSVMTLSPDDFIVTRCTYNTIGKMTKTRMGKTSRDEMCSSYLLYYANHERTADWIICGGVHDNDVIRKLPQGNDDPLPSHPELEAKKLALTYDETEVITYPPPLAQEPTIPRLR